MQAKDIMTKKVISILDDASVMDAIKLLIGKKNQWFARSRCFRKDCWSSFRKRFA